MTLGLAAHGVAVSRDLEGLVGVLVEEVNLLLAFRGIDLVVAGDLLAHIRIVDVALELESVLAGDTSWNISDYLPQSGASRQWRWQPIVAQKLV